MQQIKDFLKEKGISHYSISKEISKSKAYTNLALKQKNPGILTLEKILNTAGYTMLPLKIRKDKN